MVYGLISCNQRSQVRSMINQPENGYIAEVKSAGYELLAQYQPAEYRADQEIMLNHSTVPKAELVAEYDGMQQFYIKYRTSGSESTEEYIGLSERFLLMVGETEIPCVEAHPLTYNPGAPYRELLLLFPLTATELGKQFTLSITDFPLMGASHNLAFTLKK